MSIDGNSPELAGLTLIIDARADDFHVAIKSHQAVWGQGATISSAVGNLVVNHPECFGLKLKTTPAAAERQQQIWDKAIKAAQAPQRPLPFKELVPQLKLLFAPLGHIEDYDFDYQWGGMFDERERALIGFNSGRSLRKSVLSRDRLRQAEQLLEADGRFTSVLHYMERAGDWVLIVHDDKTPPRL